MYESTDGVSDHFAQAQVQSNRQDFPAPVTWLAKCNVHCLPAAPIVNSLW